MKAIVIFLLIIFFFAPACQHKSGKKTEISKDSLSIAYPNRGYVCFNVKATGTKERTINLGDSISAVLKYLDLDTTKNNHFKNPIIWNSTHGQIKVDVLANFDQTNRLRNFKAFWTCIGDTSFTTRKELYDILMKYSTNCLWEGITITNRGEIDTFEIRLINRVSHRFISDFRSKEMKISYECYLDR